VPRLLHRCLAILAVAFYAAATLAPCAPAEASASNAHQHHSDEAAAGDEVTLKAPCLCGCDERPDAGVAGKRLGPALLISGEPPSTAARAPRAPRREPAAPMAVLPVPDPIPIAT